MIPLKTGDETKIRALSDDVDVEDLRAGDRVELWANDGWHPGTCILVDGDNVRIQLDRPTTPAGGEA